MGVFRLSFPPVIYLSQSLTTFYGLSTGLFSLNTKTIEEKQKMALIKVKNKETGSIYQKEENEVDPEHEKQMRYI